MFPGQNGAREKPHGLPMSVTAFILPIQAATEDQQTTGISGDPRSTADTWFCCVGISIGISCTDSCLEQQQCATSRDFVAMWYQKGVPVTGTTYAEVMGHHISCSAMRITQ